MTARQTIATLRNRVGLWLFGENYDFWIGHHEPIFTHEVFAAVAYLTARRTRDRRESNRLRPPRSQRAGEIRPED